MEEKLFSIASRFRETGFSPQIASQCFLRVAALIGSGCLMREEWKPQELHLKIAEAVSSAYRKHKEAEAIEAFDDLNENLNRLSPDSIAELLNSLFNLADATGENFTSSVLRINAKILGSLNAMGWIPQELAEFIVSTVGINSSDKVYIPYAPTLPLLIPIFKLTSRVIFEDKDRVATQQAVLVSLMKNVKLECSMSEPLGHIGFLLPSEISSKVDVSLCAPPWGMRFDQFDRNRSSERLLFPTSRAEGVVIQHLSAVSRRCVAVLLPFGFLFSSLKAERDLRKYLIENGILSSVVKLPHGILSGTRMGVALIILNGSDLRGDSSVLMLDASSSKFNHKLARYHDGAGEQVRLQNTETLIEIIKENRNSNWSRVVSANELEMHDYSIMPERYLSIGKPQSRPAVLEGSEIVRLDDLAEILRPVAFSSAYRKLVSQQLLEDKNNGFKSQRNDDTFPVYEASVSDISPSGVLNRPSKSLSLTLAEYEKVKKVRLQPNDILLAVKGSVGRVAIVPSRLDGEWIPNQSFVVVRLRNKENRVSPEYLFRYLESEAVQSELTSRTGGASIKFINARDLYDLKIAVPSPATQKLLTTSHDEIVNIYEKIAKLERGATTIKGAMWGKQYQRDI